MAPRSAAILGQSPTRRITGRTCRPSCCHARRRFKTGLRRPRPQDHRCVVRDRTALDPYHFYGNIRFMPPAHYRTITIPAWTYDAVTHARDQLLERGLSSLSPEIAEPPACPACGGEVTHVTVGVEHLKCLSCGFGSHAVRVNGSTVAHVGLGVVIGLGLAALFKFLDDGSTARTRPRKVLTSNRGRFSKVKKGTSTRSRRGGK
jgi:hypothetical protein